MEPESNQYMEEQKQRLAKMVDAGLHPIATVLQMSVKDSRVCKVRVITLDLDIPKLPPKSEILEKIQPVIRDQASVMKLAATRSKNGNWHVWILLSQWIKVSDAAIAAVLAGSDIRRESASLYRCVTGELFPWVLAVPDDVYFANRFISQWQSEGLVGVASFDRSEQNPSTPDCVSDADIPF